MQATKFVPNEILAERKRSIPPAKLPRDYAFAEEALGEQEQLLPKAVATTHGVWAGLWDNTQGCRWLFVAWAIEVVWILFVVMIFSMEMWGSCPFQFGLTPACHYCFSAAFLTWNAVIITLWFFSLYTYVLLMSRGFKLTFRRLGCVVVDNDVKGVPRPPIYLFLWLTGAMIATLALGIAVLVRSESCFHDDMVYAHGHKRRSHAMYCITLLNIIVAPVLVATGRCLDLGSYLWFCLRTTVEFSQV